MQCPKCHHEVYNDAKYCPYCGSSLLNQCSRCGHHVHENDRFCSNCGLELNSNVKKEEKIEGYYVPLGQEDKVVVEDYQPSETYEDIISQENVYESVEVEPEREKVRWKPIIIGFVILVLLTVTSFVYLMGNSDTNKDNTVDNLPTNPSVTSDNSYVTYNGNVNLQGLAVLDGDVVYMTNDDGYLVSFDKDFKESKILLEEVVSYITPYNDKIYFADENNYLSVVNKDGSQKEVIIQKAVYYILLKGDCLYYQLDPDSESLYVLDLKTNESKKLNDCRSYCPNVTDDSIYYTSTDGIYVMGLDGSDDQRLIAGEIYTLLYEDSKLYYVQNNTLMIYDIKTKETKTITNMLVSSFNKSGDMIYAYTSKGLISYDLNTNKTKTLYASSLDSFQVIGDVVLVCSNDNWSIIDSQGNTYSLFEDEGEFV